MNTPTHKTQQRFAIELQLLHKIGKLADDKEITLSELINDAIREYLKTQ